MKFMVVVGASAPTEIRTGPGAPNPAWWIRASNSRGVRTARGRLGCLLLSLSAGMGNVAAGAVGGAGVVSLLKRPTCQVQLGSPGGNAEWAAVALLPEISISSVHTKVPPGTKIRALADDMALYLRFDCAINDPRTLIEGAEGGDRVWIEIFPQNDPVERIRFETDFKGERTISRLRRITGENSLEVIPDIWEDKLPGGWTSFDGKVYHGLTPGGWQAEFVLPWSKLGLAKRPPAIGLSYGRIYGDATLRPAQWEAAWPKIDSERPWILAQEPGQAVIGREGLAPTSWETELPRFGVNHGRLLFEPGSVKRAMRLTVRTEGFDRSAIGKTSLALANGATSVDFTYEVSRQLDSHWDVFTAQRVVVELEAEDGNLLYTGRVPFGRHLGVCVDEPFGEPQGPGPATANRREIWLERVVRALPRIERRTTAQGAPSDFCLYDSAGKLVANLMANDAWERLAALIEARFSKSEDRLVGAMAFIGQKSVTNLMLGPLFFKAGGEEEYHTPLHETMGPMSVMRYGGGPAVSRAAVLARFLQHIRNPATGRPYVTRTISLTRKGGPEQTDRRYTKSPNLAPFVQIPGQIGAVAVDYGTSQTLLDPTALAFFSLGERLAAVEEIRAAAPLRRDGAGRLAEIYGKIDLDEIRHQPVNRLLSRGVFPEQAPEEDGIERPYEMGAKFNVPVVVAGQNASGKAVGGFVDDWRRPGTRQGEVAVETTSEGVKVSVTVKGVPWNEFSETDRRWERVHVAFDTEHRHITFRHFMMAGDGTRNSWYEETQGIQTLCKHLATENWREWEQLGTAGWSSEILPAADGYTAVFRFSRTALGMADNPAVVGFNVWIDGRRPNYEQVFLSPPGRRVPADPMTFADLYLTGPPAVVEGVDLGIPTWLENSGKLRLRNLGSQPLAVEVRVSNQLNMRRHITSLPVVFASVPANSLAMVPFSFFVDPEEKMGSGGRQEITVEVSAAGQSFYRSAWGAAYHGPVSVYQRYGSDVGAQTRPTPGEPYFGEKLIRWMSSRLPIFEKRTTRDGAPSDFVLQAEDHSAEFDLMAPDVLDRMAAYIEKRFDTDFERLLALYCFDLQPAVARHNSGGHHLMVRADPLSILRGNFAGAGGNCGFHAALFAGLVSSLHAGGQALSARTISIWGHVITSVKWNGSRALLDNDVGHLFFTADGRDFASIEEFRSNPWLLTTAGPGEIGRYYTFVEDDAKSDAPGFGSTTSCGRFPIASPFRPTR